jgi:hypothetical protein
VLPAGWRTGSCAVCVKEVSMEFGNPPASGYRVEVGAAEIAFFRENGYLKVDRVTTEAELEWLRNVYDALLAAPRSGYLDGVFDLSRPYGTTDEPRLGQLLFPERRVPAIRDTDMWCNARNISVALLGIEADAVESWGHLIFKGAHSLTETPWHQDEAYWDVHKSYCALGSWLALDDVDTDNGCLWFVPGSHTGDVLPHRHLGGDPEVHVLELAIDVDVCAGRPVPLRAGGMTFHHSRTLHYAGVNRTGRIRRAWANEFQAAPEDRDTPADHPWWHEGMQALHESLERRKQHR